VPTTNDVSQLTGMRGGDTAQYSEISKCRACENTNLVTVLNLGLQALTGVFPKALAEDVPKAPLELVKCSSRDGTSKCGLVQLRHSCKPQDMYGANYGYRSGLNSSMVMHLKRKAEQIKQLIALSPGDFVIDIGSNDSTFLQAMFEPGVTAVGIDPTGNRFRSYYPEHIQLIPDFFSAERFLTEYRGQRAKVVTSFSMFYDLEDPINFMRDVASILSDDGIWVFEQSYLPLMLERTAYDTICHEHLEYYGLRQILYMAGRAGLRIIDVETNDINGGSFSVVAAKDASSHVTNQAAVERLQGAETELGLESLNVFEQFSGRISNHRADLRRFLDDSRDRKLRVMGYGASTKGNVILQYCGITVQDIPYIAEVNEDKFGAFTPGTKIPIISEQEARRLSPDAFLVLPWHFRDHILRRERHFIESGHSIVFPLPTVEVVAHA
jgi:NDP-4-keto-2,6-dideoxyhexose 3-C-methyltransferase